MPRISAAGPVRLEIVIVDQLPAHIKLAAGGKGRLRRFPRKVFPAQVPVNRYGCPPPCRQGFDDSIGTGDHITTREDSLRRSLQGMNIYLRSSPAGCGQAHRIPGGKKRCKAGGTGGDEYGIIVIANLTQGQVPSNLRLEAIFHTHLCHQGNFPLDQFAGKPVGRKPVGKKAARLIPGFNNGYCIPLVPQVMGSHQPCRTRPYYGNPFSLFILRSRDDLRLLPFTRFSDEPFQCTDGNRAVYLGPLANPLTGMITDAADNTGKRHCLPYQGKRLPEFSNLNQLNIAVTVDMEGTGMATG